MTDTTLAKDVKAVVAAVNPPSPAEEFAGLVQAARDSVTDDMIGRLTENLGQTLDLVDRLNRSGVTDALPAIAAMVKNGDLERLTYYARMIGAAEDAVTDDMIGRFATLAAETATVMDRLNRSGVERLIQLLDLLNASGALDRIAAKLPALVDNIDLVERLLGCLQGAAKEVRDEPAPTGGLLPLLRMMRDPENQKAIQFGIAVGRRMGRSCIG
ncbi:MAG TPA: DUF1641 domain-containing protein [Usitatibacter sp.]|nr:DUF1641 domain-containing protein [Usitatibacter sp.]